MSDPAAVLTTLHFDPVNGFYPPSDRFTYQPGPTPQYDTSGTVGIILEARQLGPFTVSEVSSGGPAGNAGIRKGDHIIKVDGHNTDGMSLEQFVGLVRGKPGTAVKLDIESGSAGVKKTIELTRY